MAALYLLVRPFWRADYYHLPIRADIAFASIWCGGIVSLLLAGWIAWHEGKSRHKGHKDSTRDPRLLKAGVALCALGYLCASPFLIQMTSTLGRIAEARLSMPSSSIEYDPTHQELMLRGAIGHNFSRQLLSALNDNPEVRVVTVTGPGGLVDEALAAARLLEERPWIGTRAYGACESACVLVFMGGEKRIAEATANFGFHKAGQFTDIPDFMADALNTGRSDASAYLLQRGIPAKIVETAERTPNDSMFYVGAVQLHEAGSINELVSNRWPVSVGIAKWLWIADRAAQNDDPSVRAFSPVASALAHADPMVSGANDNQLYSALIERDEAGVRTASLALVQLMAPQVFESAAPADAYAYLAAGSATISSIFDSGNVAACASVARGNGLSSPRDLPTTLVSEEYNTLARAIGSADERGWAKRPIANAARTDAAIVANQAISALAAEGLSVDTIESNDTGACRFTLLLLKGLLALPPDRAVLAYRAIVHSTN